MERMGSKIAGLGIQRRKSFWVLLALEVLAVALAAAGLFGKNGVYQYDASTASTLGEYDAERGACVAGAEVPLQEDFVGREMLIFLSPHSPIRKSISSGSLL